MRNANDVFIVECEGDMEEAARRVFAAMKSKDTTQIIQLNFLVPNSFMNVCLLRVLANYLQQRKAGKVNHVKVDIFIEEAIEDQDED